jgi:taurine dioxygenase
VSAALPVVSPLTSNIGAAVHGIDLRDEVSSDVAAVLRQALCDHLVLVLPGQLLTTEQQERFVAIFAEPEPHPVNAFLGETAVSTVIDPDLIRVPTQTAADPADMGDYLAEFQSWHTDAAFCAWIPKVASLRAEVIPLR